MPSALSMPMKESVPAIGNALANLGAAETYNERIFPYRGQWFPNPGKPSMRVRYDGIADDSRDGPPIVNSPASLRFEVQVVHPEYGPGGEVVNGVEYAQLRVIEGTSDFYQALQDDPTLGGLVINTEVAGSIAGPIDVSDTDHEGEIIVVICDLY